MFVISFSFFFNFLSFFFFLFFNYFFLLSVRVLYILTLYKPVGCCDGGLGGWVLVWDGITEYFSLGNYA